MTFPRIAIVAPSLAIVGGQGVQAHQLSLELRNAGYCAALVPINPVFPRALRRVRRVPWARTLLNESLYIPSLLRLRAADVVHVFSASYWSFLISPAPAMAVARALGKRVVLNYHSGEADDHLSRWGLLVHPWLALAHDLVVPSQYLRTVFSQYGYATRVVPN